MSLWISCFSSEAPSIGPSKHPLGGQERARRRLLLLAIDKVLLWGQAPRPSWPTIQLEHQICPSFLGAPLTIWLPPSSSSLQRKSTSGFHSPILRSLFSSQHTPLCSAALPLVFPLLLFRLLLFAWTPPSIFCFSGLPCSLRSSCSVPFYCSLIPELQQFLFLCFPLHRSTSWHLYKRPAHASLCRSTLCLPHLLLVGIMRVIDRPPTHHHLLCQFRTATLMAHALPFLPSAHTVLQAQPLKAWKRSSLLRTAPCRCKPILKCMPCET